MNLKELKPLKDTPVAGLAEVDISTLSEGAAFILLAYRTGAKPKPADVQTVCRRNGLPDEEERFYLVNVLPTYEFLYADKIVNGKRVRRLVGRLETAAQELADAVDAVSGDAVDVYALAAIIKPRRYKPRHVRATEETHELLISSVVSLTQRLGHPPTLRQVAKEMEISVSTVHYHVALMKEDGLLAHDGQHTLRVLSDGHH